MKSAGCTLKILTITVLALLSSSRFVPDEKIVYVLETIEVTKDFDGKGKLFIWKGLGGCTQEEGMPPMFKIHSNINFRNVVMVNAPDGIHVIGSNVSINNIKNLDVCEDAITLKENNRNITISHSEFRHCEDKALQITKARDIRIESNIFKNCTRPIKIKDEVENVLILNNYFEIVRDGIKIDSAKEVKIKGNTFYKCKNALVAPDKSSYVNLGDNRFIKVRDGKF